MNNKISVIIATYNWPKALYLVLSALSHQSENSFEVLIADDGSTDETKKMLENTKQEFNFPLQHIYQDDNGFRAAKIRNKAVAKASGDYIVFLDQDMIPRKDFIARHQRLKQKGFFTCGNRVLINEPFTEETLKKNTALYNKSFLWCFKHHMKKHFNSAFKLLRLPLGPLRYCNKRSWKNTKNLLGVWRKDFIAVNGYDESFNGWGYEDSDLVIRLIQYGVLRKSSRLATTVFHLYHPEASRQQEKENWKRLQKTLKTPKTDFPGVTQYL